MKFDDVFKQLGEFGPSQKKLYVLLCLPAIPIALQLMQAVVFFFAVPKHRCSIPGLENDTYRIQNEAHERLINISIPKDSDFYGNSKYSSCELYQSTNTSDLWSPDVTNTTVPCHSWVYDKSTYTSTIAQSLDLVCQKKSYVSHGKMVVMAGILVGALLGGSLSDMFGRRSVSVLFTFLMTIVIVALAWANSVLVVFMLLFLTHVLTQYMIFFVFGMEIVAPAKRMWAGVVMNFFWCAGCLLTALAAYLLRDWRTRQLVVSVPTVLFAYLYFLPESPRWLFEHGKREEAKAVLMKMAKGNKLQLSPNILDQVGLENDKESPEPFWTLFKSAVLMRRMIIIWYIWFAVGMAFYGLSMNVTNLSGSVYFNFFLFAFAEIFAYVFCFLLLNRIGRKRLLCLSLMVTAAACILPLVPVAVFDTPNKWAINILALTGNTCACAAIAIVYTFTAELVPTTTRNFGIGCSSMCCRVGSLISPYIVDLTLYVTGRFGQILPMLVFGAFTALAGILTLLLPETLNRRLPETIEDAEKFGTNKYEEEIMIKQESVELDPLNTDQSGSEAVKA